MSHPKIKTQPDLTLTSPKHQAAIAAGKDHFSAWQYNVADHLKGKTVEEIKQQLKATAHPFAVAMENWISDFNFSSLVRNANAFNFREVFYIGDKKVDRRGMVGTHNYLNVNFIESIDDLIKLKGKYVFAGIDNIPGSISFSSYSAVPNTLFIFGSEGTGLTPTLQGLCDIIIHIEQHGSVRSLNAAVASGIIMYNVINNFKR
jgi:tRNA G18 (ribose-2'-O)-methylase SpoU